MKLTKEQLQKIIQEELAIAIEEGELEEGFLDRLFGKEDTKITGFVSDEDIKSKLDDVQRALGKLLNTAARQENGELVKLVKPISDQIAKMYSMAVPKGKELPPSDFKTGQRFRSAARPGRPTGWIEMTKGE